MKKILIGLIGIFLLAVPAWALEEADLLNKGIQQVKNGDYEKAFQTVDQAALSIWLKAPFSLRNVFYTKGKATGFGVYNKRPDNIYPTEGEPIYIYLEPRFYKMVRNKKGVFSFGFDVDLYLSDKDGGVLFGREGFLKTTMRSLVPNREFMLTITLNLSGAEPGDYVVRLVVTDKVSKQKAETRLPLVIKAAAKTN
ncbi:hypothetical protein [Dethiosulfatarculus sandiegensis]|uniref:Uncharacterized protein n=1 Tax=Dethiosulfatarculus sandiegensis TaxID=1429043 RepID=A0A0D2HW94_9BACT|nr:hypothetical protein [Dethiosulfatarculus sandiegensis]KIX14643.1 hypothetical protein X474_08105 [Dethiosulfatarculus sandiegensis]